MKEQARNDELMLRVPQHGTVTWVVAGLLNAMLLGLVSGLFQPLAPIVGIVILGTIGAAIHAALVEQTLIVTIHPDYIQVDGWVGWPLPRPIVTGRPLEGLTLAFSEQGAVNRKRVYGLTLQTPSYPDLHVPFLRLSSEDRQALLERVEGMQLLGDSD